MISGNLAFFMDPGHLLFVALPMLALTLLAQMWVKSAYSKYSQIGGSRRISGAEAAQRMLQSAGVHDVRIEESHGWLSDHYSPTEKVVRLSPENYMGTSLAAVGIAAHEVGHAIQHARSFGPLVVRNMAVPLAGIGSTFGYIAIILGLIMTQVANNPISLIGLALLACVVLFQVVNLPVELDASRRALKLLPSTGILHDEEVPGARKVLTAAAFTYVAATIAAVWELIYWAMRLGLLGGGNDE